MKTVAFVSKRKGIGEEFLWNSMLVKFVHSVNGKSKKKMLSRYVPTVERHNTKPVGNRTKVVRPIVAQHRLLGNQAARFLLILVKTAVPL